MIHLALYQPCIPQNTGNIIRLAANTGAQLHLIHPLAFTWDDKRLRRSGLDYHEFAQVQHHQNWQDFQSFSQGRRLWALSTHGQKSVFQARFEDEDILLFGSESQGLNAVREALPPSCLLRLPMQATSRSLNLSNTVAVVLYEALRQNIDVEALVL